MTFELFVRPSLLKMRGLSILSRPLVQAQLTEPAAHQPGRRSYQRAFVWQEQEAWFGHPVGGQGSHQMRSMTLANALLILPHDVSEHPGGRLCHGRAAVMTPLVAAILAGGQSRRMGRDKASIIWQGETLLARTARVAQEAGFAVMVIGRERPDGWPLPDTRFVPDAYPGQGPLGGLATALEAANQDVLLLACDMPLLSVEAIAWLNGQTLGSMASPCDMGSSGSRCFRATAGRTATDSGAD